ncbi:molybdopterin converting factor subunit 1 [Virgibacillus sp. 179-BFC.A HS]|uniref:Molybdopterin synthase sulfur carrier subunit n=1 Tax=Tigheibacillus jepli TaxID=3035914 RepID=A0ABU5CIL4_9BACI|nr:molybdopterin converting factor subunit 1 [Virgibacillus sp. 179-BFC.A HS]MDY0406187.1 molybdopterin converting factor subunit 1 [Virgibacillus sp. 179-BFC.A HS]
MVNVLFFAELQEAVGKERVAVDAVGLTIAELKQQCSQEYDVPRLDQAMVALNEEYTADDALLADGDTVAFIPPVSGG